MFAVDNKNITSITSLDPYYNYHEGLYVFLTILNFLIIIVSVLGNGTVIYASKQFNAIKMDKSSLVFIENLAAADILIAIIYYIPIAVTLITKQWVFGKMVCFVNAYFTSTPSVAEILILTSISIHRIWFLKNPFSPEVKTWKIHVICTVIWLVAFLLPIIFTIMDTFAYYDPFALSCLSSVYDDERYLMLATLGTVLLVLLPLLIVIVCNVYLLYISITHNKRMGRSVSGIAVLTITVICWTFIISWLPFVIKGGLKALEVQLEPWFHTLQIEMLGLNVTLNPLIYTITNKRFRKFLMRKVFHVGRDRRVSGSQGSVRGETGLERQNRRRSTMLEAGSTVFYRSSSEQQFRISSLSSPIPE